MPHNPVLHMLPDMELQGLLFHLLHFSLALV
jgi:hypothetical protein